MNSIIIIIIKFSFLAHRQIERQKEESKESLKYSKYCSLYVMHRFVNVTYAMIFLERGNRFGDKEYVEVDSGDSWEGDKKKIKKENRVFPRVKNYFVLLVEGGGGCIIFQRRPCRTIGERGRRGGTVSGRRPTSNVNSYSLPLHFSLFSSHSFFPSFDFPLLIRSNNTGI